MAEGRFLLNGVWTIRTVDLQTILDHNQPTTPDKPSMAKPDIRPPTLGVMTKSLVASPVINFIIPARVRSKDKNDVVFVGVSVSPKEE